MKMTCKNASIFISIVLQINILLE